MKKTCRKLLSVLLAVIMAIGLTMPSVPSRKYPKQQGCGIILQKEKRGEAKCQNIQ